MTRLKQTINRLSSFQLVGLLLILQMAVVGMVLSVQYFSYKQPTFNIQLIREGENLSLAYEDCLVLVEKRFLSDDIIQYIFRFNKK